MAGFLFQLGLRADVDPFVRSFGFTPRAVTEALDSGQFDALYLVGLTVLTSMFLHGGWFHIIGNLLYLRVFGDNVEDRFGHAVFLVFYLASGCAGAAGQYLYDPLSDVPMVGASGAIAGVLGAYIVLFPRARVLTLFPVFVVFTFIEVPAFVFLGIWALQQLLNGYLVVSATAMSGAGIAWFAHLGGFALGVVCGLIGRQFRNR